MIRSSNILTIVRTARKGPSRDSKLGGSNSRQSNALQDFRKFVPQNTEKSDDEHWRNIAAHDYV